MTANVEWARLDSGLELPYVQQGGATCPPAVLLHGFAESWRSFELLLAELPPSLRVLALSQRGHGGPRTMGGSITLELLASDVAGFLDAVGIERAVIAGSSSGGYVAQQLAMDHPGRVLGLVLIGAPRSLRQLSAAARLDRSLRDQPAFPDPSFVRDFNAGAIVRPLPETFLAAMVEDGAAVPTEVWRQTLAALVRATPPTEAGVVSAPTLVIWGDRDPFVSRADTEALCGAIAGATLVVYEDTGHAPAWEEPGRVAADLSRFALGL